MSACPRSGSSAPIVPGARGRSADTVVYAIANVLQFVSGVFFVYSKLPAWMRDVAAVSRSSG